MAISQSQEKLHTNPQTSLNIIFDQSYYTNCTPSEKRILKYLQSFGSLRFKIRHKVVASVCGCSEKTVQRATNKFKVDGILTKTQINPYSPNNYNFESDAFTICNNFVFKQSVSSRIENVQQVKYIRNLYKEPVTSTSNQLSARAHAREITFQLDTGKLVFKKKEKMETGNGKELELDELKHELLAYFTLTPSEEAKLAVFQYEALLGAYKELQTLLQSKKGVQLSDSFSWFIAQCKKYSENHKLPMDWRKFYELCRISALDPYERSIARPLVIPPTSNRGDRNPKSDNTAKSNYKPVAWEPDEPTRDEQIEKLTKSIEFSMKVLADPNHPSRVNDKFYDVESAKMWITKELQNLEDLTNFKKPEPVTEVQKQKLFASFGDGLFN